MSGLTLAIEMSQRQASVALGEGDRVIAVRRWSNTEHDQSDPLLAEIDALVRGAGATPANLGAIVVSSGPGGFTGLRIAVTAAKFLAECLHCPLVAVPSGLVAAADARREAVAGAAVGRPRIVGLAAKRDTAWIALVDGDGAHVRLRCEPAVLGPEDFRPAESGASAFLADEHMSAALLALARAAGLEIIPPHFTAEACLAVGAAMLKRGELADSATLVPVYPREPEAVTLWRERHG